MVVTAMDPALLAEKPSMNNAMHLRRWRSHGSHDEECGLSELDSTPASVDSFVVTPDGRALPAMHQLFADKDGSLHLIDVPIIDLDALGPDSPIKREVPGRRTMNCPFLTPPMEDLTPAAPVLPLAWHARPMLKWHKAYKDEEPVDRKTATVIEVDVDGVAHVHRMKAREFWKKVHDVADDEQEYVVDLHGVAHPAHKVFIDDHGETLVLIREDDETVPGHGVYDEVPTPEVEFRPDHEVVFIAGASGPAFFGTPVMVSCYDEATGESHLKVINKITPFPDFVSRMKHPKAIPYTAPKLLTCDMSRYPSVRDRFTIVRPRDGSVLATYRRVMYARGDGVVVGYRTLNPSDLAVVTETGTGMKCVQVRRDAAPMYTPTQDVVIISCNKYKMNFRGVNVMAANPRTGACTPVARIADFSDFSDAPTVAAVSGCGITNVPGVYAAPVAGLTAPRRRLIAASPAPLLLTPPPRPTRLPRTAPKSCSPVFVCDENGLRYKTAVPRPSDVYEGVIIARPDGTAMRGHTVISMAEHQPHLPRWVGGRTRVVCVPDKA